MGAHVPKLVSPITGHEEPARGHAFHFPEDEANLSRWRAFTRVRFVAEHYDSPDAAHASAERLRGLPGSRVVSYVVEERRPS
jgi:hypothetical protein